MDILDAWKRPKQQRKPETIEIFRAYDIRGLYPSAIDEKIAYRIGRAFIEFINKPKVAVGRDARKSSPALHEALVQGMTDQGAEVTDIGVCTTPMLYFAVWKYKLDGGVMVTASHNPKEYNGMKLTGEKAIPLTGDSGISQIGEAVFAHDFARMPKKGRIIKKDVIKDYMKFVLKFAEKIPKVKLVVDGGNGMAAVDFPEMMKSFRWVKVIPMNMEIDCTFPAHEPNPLDFSTLKGLQKKVKHEDADLGIAFDGDCDRVFFVDDKGEVVTPDTIAALISKDMLKNKMHTICYDLRSTMALPEEIDDNGGRPMETRVGHSYIKSIMRDKGCSFASELSGHFYYRENSYCESSLITILKVLNILSKEKKPLSELISPIRRYFHSGEINFEVKDKDLVLEKMEELHSDGNVNKMDGLKVEYADWWFSLRKSNTEPKLRLNLEAREKNKMEFMLKEIRKEIKEIENICE
ncbi:phosphomannomutase/phosphoglucomutase [Candidatus Woesearchaeota archaeon]|nr:phosphomannomutase/phosphoglucomutase [Candidatus Woesearchaeota archaeon]